MLFQFRKGVSTIPLLVVVAIATTILFATTATADDILDTDCDGSCVRGDGTFCGIDGLCHAFSCSNWYEYGPPEFTGYDNNASSSISSSEPLTCVDIPTTEPGSDEVFYWSVAFRCVDLTPAPISMGFNRKCTATPVPTTAFTCYELSNETDFGLFLAEADASNLECNGDDESPTFTYTVVHETGGIKTLIRDGYTSTSEFDPAKAVGGTLFSVTEEIDTLSPTAMPTAPPNEMPTTSSASFFYAKNQLMVLAAGVLLLSRFLVVPLVV